MIDDFREYYEATEPGRRERAYAWATAIGLQDVDRLKPSSYLIETAKRNIEGEITQEQARQIVDAYYESKDAHDVPPDTKEADKVAARMIGVINSPTFTFSPTYYLGLHQRFRHALRLLHLGGLADTSVPRGKHADGCAVFNQVSPFARI